MAGGKECDRQIRLTFRFTLLDPHGTVPLVRNGFEVPIDRFRVLSTGAGVVASGVPHPTVSRLPSPADFWRPYLCGLARGASIAVILRSEYFVDR